MIDVAPVAASHAHGELPANGVGADGAAKAKILAGGAGVVQFGLGAAGLAQGGEGDSGIHAGVRNDEVLEEVVLVLGHGNQLLAPRTRYGVGHVLDELGSNVQESPFV